MTKDPAASSLFHRKDAKSAKNGIRFKQKEPSNTKAQSHEDFSLSSSYFVTWCLLFNKPCFFSFANFAPRVCDPLR